jgi:hypothetical protein
MDFFKIENNKQQIVNTNYFDTEHAEKGYFYLSTNAGCVRLLVPDSQTSAILEFQAAKYVTFSVGPWLDQGRDIGLELLFEDFSDSPYALHMIPEQCDMLPNGKGEWTFAVWTRDGKQFECPLRYRRVKEIPCLKEWKENE